MRAWDIVCERGILYGRRRKVKSIKYTQTPYISLDRSKVTFEAIVINITFGSYTVWCSKRRQSQLTKRLRGIWHAWHFCYALNFFKE